MGSERAESTDWAWEVLNRVPAEALVAIFSRL